MVKLLLGWTIIPGREDEYFDFLTKEFEPTLRDLGLQTTDAWLTVYGDFPQVLTGILIPNLDVARRVLTSDRWMRLQARLAELVTDYQQKLVPARGGFQI